jgi:Predicted membrane-associated Zn-dependent proteases 1
MPMIQSFLHAFTPQGVLVFLLIITVLVAAHEYGHYLFAKIFGMGVEEFAIGFGRNPIWTYRRKTYRLPIARDQVVEPYSESSASGMPGEMTRRTITPVVVETPEGRYIEETTNFTIRAWPLGGFVRIKGMMPEDDGSEVRIPGGFYSKDPWKRFIVLLAGPVFSVLAGVIMLIGLYSTAGTEKQPGPGVGLYSEGLSSVCCRAPGRRPHRFDKWRSNLLLLPDDRACPKRGRPETQFRLSPRWKAAQHDCHTASDFSTLARSR